MQIVAAPAIPAASAPPTREEIERIGVFEYCEIDRLNVNAIHDLAKYALTLLDERLDLRRTLAGAVADRDRWMGVAERSCREESALRSHLLDSRAETKHWADEAKRLEAKNDRLRISSEDECGKVVDERDRFEEQITAIYHALGGQDEWSNEHDLGADALELAENTASSRHEALTEAVYAIGKLRELAELRKREEVESWLAQAAGAVVALRSPSPPSSPA